MKKKSNIYISIYKQDYIWHKINTKIKIKQQNKSCKKLSIVLPKAQSKIMVSKGEKEEETGASRARTFLEKSQAPVTFVKHGTI